MSEPTNDEKRSGTRRLKKDLERQEETSLGGVRPRTQKQRLIDVSRISRMFPGKVFRYVRKDRVEEREDLGYAVVPAADAEKGKAAPTRADMVLMAIDRKEYERSRSALALENRRRLGASRGEFLAAVANEEREYRAQGVITDEQSLLVNDAE